MAEWTLNLRVGLNAFEPGQSHVLHAHAGTDKMYYVVDGPDGVPHGVKNTGNGRLLVLAVTPPISHPGASAGRSDPLGQIEPGVGAKNGDGE